ncbi:MAG: YkgJ family cysteine cluster protein [Kiritimatiellaeota bacterium]|nr:YkgJ family cysteine cluster protein [Kiritimatiellota bacterium]
MPAQRVHIVRDQRFSCVQCATCCRRWHVALFPVEVGRIRALDWRGEEDFEPGDPVHLIGGHPFLAHRADGDCVFLDAKTRLCRIHRRFGEIAKPLGCRVYPLNIAAAYAGEVSVNVRMDCPAVRLNQGRLITDRRRDIGGLVRELGVRGGFTEDHLAGISRQSIEFILDSLRRGILNRSEYSPGLCALALLFAVGRLEDLGVPFLNDLPTLREVMPSFIERTIRTVSERTWAPAGSFWRCVFRSWLSSYLRRDEEVIYRGFAFRFYRTRHLALIALGRGTPGALGSEHPRVPLAAVPLFPGTERAAGPPPIAATPGANEIWECWVRFLNERLETLQFFGVTYYGAPFFIGLRALVQTYAFVLAAARIHATARHAGVIDSTDVQYGVGVIDHGLGRSKLLEATRYRVLEHLFGRFRYGRLLAALGWE